MLKFRTLRGAGLAGLLLLVVAACGGGSEFACGDDGLECDEGEICLGRSAQFGAEYTCAANPCGSGTIDCSCAEAACGDGFVCANVEEREVLCVCPAC